MESTPADVAVLRTMSIDGEPVKRAPDRLALLALVARRNDEVSRLPLADLLDRLGRGGVMHPEDQPMNLDRTGRKLSESLSRLGRLLQTRLTRTNATASLRIIEGGCDVDRFESACGRAQDPFLAADRRVRAADEALAMLSQPLWPDLSEAIDHDIFILRPFRETLERQRGALIVTRTLDLLRSGQYLRALEIESLAVEECDLDADPNAALAVVYARWANGRHIEAYELLGTIEERYADLGFGARSDYQEIERCLLERVEFVPEHLPLSRSNTNRDLTSADSRPHPGFGESADGESPSIPGSSKRVVRTVPTAPAGSADDSETEPSLGRPWAGRLRQTEQIFGRSGDLFHLGLGVDAVSGRSIRCWIIAGPVGIGRSRFLRRVEAMAADRGYDTAFASAAEHEHEPGGTVLSLINRVDPLVSAELGATDSTNPATLAGALIDLVRFGPLVACIDDLQLATPADLAAIGVALTRTTACYPLHIVCGFNPDIEANSREARNALAAILAHRRTEQVTLRPLTDSALSAMTVELFGMALEPADVHRVVAITGGNPDRIQRGLTIMADGGHVRMSGGGIRIQQDALDRWAMVGETGMISGARPGEQTDLVNRRLWTATALLGVGHRVDDLARLLDQSPEAIRRSIDESADRMGGTLEVVRGRVQWSPSDPPGPIGAAAERVERSDLLDAAVRSAMPQDPSAASDRELDAHVARWLIAAQPVQPAELGTAASAVSASVERAAGELERSASWVAAARLWDLLATLRQGQDRQDAELHAGMAWIRGHDGDRADRRLRGARSHGDAQRSAEALLWWARTNASLLWPGASHVAAEVDEWLAQPPSGLDWTWVAKLHAVLAEAYAVEQQDALAQDRIRRARSARPADADADPAEVEFAAGVADLMAFRSRPAVGHFSAAARTAHGDPWVSSWCAARNLLLRSITAPLGVTPANVAGAKSVCLSALSWSDALICSVGAAQAATVQGDREWARSELQEAVEYRNRSEYGLLDQPIRLLAAQLHGGALWFPDEFVDDLMEQWIASFGESHTWPGTAEAMVDGWTDRLEDLRPDLWNSTAIALLGDAALRSGTGDRERIASLVRTLTDGGNRWVFGVTQDLLGLLARLS